MSGGNVQGRIVQGSFSGFVWAGVIRSALYSTVGIIQSRTLYNDNFVVELGFQRGVRDRYRYIDTGRDRYRNRDTLRQIDRKKDRE